MDAKLAAKRLKFLQKFSVEGRHYTDEHKNSLYDKIISGGDEYPVANILKSDNNLSSENIHKILDNHFLDKQMLDSNQKNFNREHLTKIFANIGNSFERIPIVENGLAHPLATEEHVDMIVKNPEISEAVSAKAARLSKSPRNVQTAFDTKKASIIQGAISSGKATKEQLEWAADESNHGHFGVSIVAGARLRKLNEEPA